MSDASIPPPARKYWAFLSYSHADKAWALKLHKWLETYRLPRELVGTEPAPPAEDPVPARCFPVFRDREELAGSHDLGARIRDALQASRTLVVICSPRAAASRWVGEEIRAFRALGRHDRVLALIVDGEPHAGDGRECFPPALLEPIEPGGAPLEVIAADAREEADGWKAARLKILAGMLAVPFDALARRDQARAIARLRAVVAGVLLLAVAFAGLGVAVLLQRNEAVRQRERAVAARDSAESLNEFMLLGLREKLRAIGRLDVLEDVTERALEYYRALDPGDWDDNARRHQAVGLDYVAETLSQSGKAAEAVAQYEMALETWRELARNHPTDDGLQDDLAICLQSLAANKLALGDLDGALAAADEAAAIGRELSARAPEAARGHRIFAAALGVRAAALQRGNDTEEALLSMLKGFEESEKAVACGDAGTADVRVFLQACDQLAGFCSTHGMEDEGVDYARKGGKAAEAVWRSDVGNAEFALRAAQASDTLGIVLAGAGRLEEAEKSSRDAVNMLRGIRERDPGNVSIRRSMAVSLNNLGAVLQRRNKPDEALKNYEEARHTFLDLVRHYPENFVWRRDLYLSYKRMAALGTQTRDYEFALQRIDDAIAMAEFTQNRFPQNATALYDLAHAWAVKSEIHRDNGDPAAEAGAVAQALRHARAGLALDPGSDSLARLAESLASGPQPRP